MTRRDSRSGSAEHGMNIGVPRSDQPRHRLWRKRIINVANLQLEGLLIAVAAINNALVPKGLLNIEDGP